MWADGFSDKDPCVHPAVAVRFLARCLVLPVQEWGCGLPFPMGAAVVAAGGFLVAALWIDTIATELVSIIEYLGLLSGINHTVGLHGDLPCSCRGCLRPGSTCRVIPEELVLLPLA